MTKSSFGVAFHRFQPPSDVATQAQAAEQAGFDEFWVLEDSFFTSGPALAAAALTATSSIKVGIGIVPSRTRHPALIAMEFATLAGLASGRFIGGIGHGVSGWMAQMGLASTSPLTALAETVHVVQELLGGNRVTLEGRYTELHDIGLDVLPPSKPPVFTGVRNQKSLQISGRYADGTILAELCSPEYFSWARDHISEGGGDESHQMVVFCSAAVSESGDGSDAREALVPFAASVFAYAPVGLRLLPFYDELERTASKVGWEQTLSAMPSDYWRRIGPIGTRDDAAQHLHMMMDHGANSLVIFPDPGDPIGDLQRFAKDVFPLVK